MEHVGKAIALLALIMFVLGPAARAFRLLFRRMGQKYLIGQAMKADSTEGRDAGFRVLARALLEYEGLDPDDFTPDQQISYLNIMKQIHFPGSPVWMPRSYLGMRWKHDCEECTFLGQCNEYDLYFCKKSNIPTVIARFGNEGSQYLSGLGMALAELQIAEKRAKDLGLL